jgi:predicted transcriptional regulator
MTMVTVGISSVEESKRRFKAAMNGEPQGAFISFATQELLWQALTTKRWQILNVMTGAGPLSIREVARRVQRDVKAVHGDVSALLLCGLLDKTDSGQVVFPYDAVHVDFMLRAA